MEIVVTSLLWGLIFGALGLTIFGLFYMIREEL